MMSRYEFEQIRTNAYHLALDIGVRPAARALGLSEDRLRKWSQRGKWRIGKTIAQKARIPPGVTGVTTRDAKLRILAQQEDRARLAMSRTGMRAFEHCDTLSDDALLERDKAIALSAHGKNLALAHNWSQQNSQVAVQVNVPMPTEAERAKLDEIDRKLDLIFAPDS